MQCLACTDTHPVIQTHWLDALTWWSTTPERREALWSTRQGVKKLIVPSMSTNYTVKNLYSTPNLWFRSIQAIHGSKHDPLSRSKIIRFILPIFSDVSFPTYHGYRSATCAGMAASYRRQTWPGPVLGGSKTWKPTKLNHRVLVPQLIYYHKELTVPDSTHVLYLELWLGLYHLVV